MRNYLGTNLTYSLLHGKFTLTLGSLFGGLGTIFSRLLGKIIDVDAAFGEEFLHVRVSGLHC